MIDSYWADATLGVALFFTIGVNTNVEDSRQPLEATKAKGITQYVFIV